MDVAEIKQFVYFLLGMTSILMLLISLLNIQLYTYCLLISNKQTFWNWTDKVLVLINFNKCTTRFIVRMFHPHKDYCLVRPFMP